MHRPTWPKSILIQRLIVLAALVSLPGVLVAQPNRIAGKIVDSQRFTLSGHIHPNARSEYDQGKADPALELNSVTLVLKPSASQQAALNQLLAEQQDPASKNYHNWLTPEQYADRFGASQDDIDKIAAWLKSQQLTVTSVARGRNAVMLQGTAAQAESAFGTEIHMYLVAGETHYANATEPSLPVALQGVVQAIRGLHNFRLKPRIRKLTPVALSGNGATPNYTSSGSHYLAPDDFATIYNLAPLYSKGIDGTGQKIAIAGQTTITTSHLSTFRSYYGLPAPNLTTLLVPNTENPGSSAIDVPESDLDLELASAVARNASLIFVYSYNVFDAVQYAIDQNLAPVISTSYGECEFGGRDGTESDALTWQSWAQQGNAQGITWVASSGDSGAADCYEAASGSSPADNDLSLAVDLPGAIPEVTSVGGTEFNEGSGSYWNTSNTSTYESAKSYIPEIAWNDTVEDGSPSASGGGASIFFPKPSWQTGTGVPNDGARDVPDVALAASADHDGYRIYTTESSGRTSSTTWYIVGGTSCGAPTFSGILTLLNQYLVANGYQSSSGLGNVNSQLYGFAASTPSAFHDVTSGNNIVSASTCTGPRCTSGSTSSGGYYAGVGYDQVTGLGSINAFNFVTAWHTGALLVKATPTLTLAAGPATLSTAGSTTLTATVTSGNGNTPTGTVTFSLGATALGTATLSGSSGTATASLTVGGAGLTIGSDTIAAAYGGDGSDNTATAATTLTVVSPASVVPSIGGVTNAASYNQSYAPGMVASIFGTNLALSTNSASTVPLPTSLDNVSVTVNGFAAPFYYVSPGQLNVQIPYETPSSGKAVLVVSNNGQTASIAIQMLAAAPGIFTDSNGALVPTSTATRGQNLTMYVTGVGAVTPSVATGAVPGGVTTPIPAQTTLVTLGGVQVPAADISYIGIPSWSVGVLQINFTVPSTAAVGTQSVVVSVGGVASAGVPLTVK
jgi:uncharacterized protein (TIGR03437 family)